MRTAGSETRRRTRRARTLTRPSATLSRSRRREESVSDASGERDFGFAADRGGIC